MKYSKEAAIAIPVQPGPVLPPWAALPRANAVSRTYSYLPCPGPDLWKETPRECLCRGPRLQLWLQHGFLSKEKYNELSLFKIRRYLYCKLYMHYLIFTVSESLRRLVSQQSWKGRMRKVK